VAITAIATMIQAAITFHGLRTMKRPSAASEAT
jgi:hypothetical protein